MVNTKKERLGDFLYSRIAISHAIIDKPNVEAEEIKRLGKHITILENKVEY
jgi:hypothetical protein